MSILLYISVFHVLFHSTVVDVVCIDRIAVPTANAPLHEAKFEAFSSQNRKRPY